MTDELRTTFGRKLTLGEPDLQKPEGNLREDFNTYVLHGDNLWGDAITWTRPPTADKPNIGRVCGWQQTRPVPGDRLLVKMKSGRWSWWLIAEVELCDDPSDMFFADVVGPYGYVEGDELPRTNSASEFVGDGPYAGAIEGIRRARMARE